MWGPVWLRMLSGDNKRLGKAAHDKCLRSTMKIFWTLTFSNKQLVKQTGQGCMHVTVTRSGWSLSSHVL